MRELSPLQSCNCQTCHAKWTCHTCTQNAPIPSTLTCTICDKSRKAWIIVNCSKCFSPNHRACILKSQNSTDFKSWQCENCRAKVSQAQTTTQTIATIPIKPLVTCLPRGIRIGHLNVRDILSNDKKVEVHELLERLKFDVFVISETWLTASITDDEVGFVGYNLVRQDR